VPGRHRKSGVVGNEGIGEEVPRKSGERRHIRIVGAEPRTEAKGSVPTDKEVLAWDQRAVERFSERSEDNEIAQVVDRLVARCEAPEIEVLCKFLGARGSDLSDKPMPSQLGLRGLVLCGPPGVDAIGTAFRTLRVRYAAKAFVVLIRVAEGKGLTNPFSGYRIIPDHFLDRPLPPGTQEAAQRLLSGIASEAVLNDPVAMRVMAGVLSEAAIRGEGDRYEEAATVVRLLSEASIRLTPAVLDDFEALINAGRAESAYQRFFENYPVLIDPLAAEVVSQQRLGSEHATDFALRRHDGGWTLIEIEKPQDALFTNRGDFTANFTHAFGQVLDFQQWVDGNVAYAEKHMPGVQAPRGALIMGRRESLSTRQARKLKQFAENSRRVEIVTYDELLARGRQLYASLWHRVPSK
jgi:Shedu protein SduA, C-terminal